VDRLSLPQGSVLRHAHRRCAAVAPTLNRTCDARYLRQNRQRLAGCGLIIAGVGLLIAV